MYEFKKIFSSHFATFYNYNTNIKKSQKIKYITLIIISIFAAALFPYFNKDFLSSIIGVFSILIGFTLNILFFLIPKPLFEEHEANFSKVQKLKIKKMNILQREIITNVLYFNLISLVIVSLATIFIITSSTPFGKLEILDKNILPTISQLTAFLIQLPVVSFYYFILLEAFMNLYRLVSRVSFFFRERLSFNDNIIKGTNITSA